MLLLWLALLLTVPFSLTALSSQESTPTRLDVRTHQRLFTAPTADLAVRVTLLALPLLHRPGRDGAYAALVLARLFARDDAVQGLPGFLDWASAELAEGEREREANLVAALMTFLAVLPGMISPQHLPTLGTFLDDVLLPHLCGGKTGASSGLIRKLAVKARGRWWLARLGRGLHDDPDAELPEGIEEVLDDLMSGLGDKDTIVRYSAAKYLARIAALLPPDLSDQIVMATIALYAGTDDEPVIETAWGTVIDPGGSAASGGAMGLGGVEGTRGEARWHGVCLAVAELGRRGLLSEAAVTEAVPWVVKALTFDLRRASHSIGSNVRDAASYVLWSLSRASSPEQMAPFAEHMATSLVSVAVFDREVGVRRAASAAFQEGVGRLGLYPAGIDVLGKTDFYSVSVRRKAFTLAAPAVAVHPVYRAAMREHLHNTTLRHWDSAMRTAGASALTALLALAPEDVDDSVSRELVQVTALDPTSVHGALVALAETAPLVDDVCKDTLLTSLTGVRAAALITANAPEIVAAGCALAGAALTPTADLAPVTRFFDAAARRRETAVHNTLAQASRQISIVRPADAPVYIAQSVANLDSGRAAQRQAHALCLGHYVYRSRSEMAAPLDALLALMDPAAKADVETRRNAVRSVADVAVQRGEDGVVLATVDDYKRVLDVVIAALDDYTTDQRGDVGSWIRGAAVRALARMISSVAGDANAITRIPQAAFSAATSGIAKQGFEKLEVLRDAATEAWGVLLAADADAVWHWSAARAILPDTPSAQWFTAGLALLDTPARPSILAGLIQTAGSAVPTSADRAISPLLAKLHADTALAAPVVADIAALLAANLSSNRVAVPALNTLARLFDARILTGDAGEKPADRALALAMRGVGVLKSIERIGAGMRVVVAALALPYPLLRVKAAGALEPLLVHRFPRIRAMTAEAVYLLLSEEDEVEGELEEALLETSWTGEEASEAGPRVVVLLHEHVFA